MYKQNKQAKTSISVNDSYVGEPIEAKIRRILNNKEPIKDGSPLIYTDRKEGVREDMDIRTDRWEVARAATDIVAKAHLAKREDRQLGEDAKKGAEAEKGGQSEKTGDVTP